MTGPRLALALAATLLAAPILLATQCLAQDYPTRPIKIIVPFGAGGPADVTARLIGNVLQEKFGQPFVVENRTGAGGVIGTLEAAKSPPDGYTLLMMSNTQTANESLVPQPQRKYELMRDLAPIAPVNYSDLVIVVHPQVPAKTLQEFIALAKSQPGKLNYASSGQGNPSHLQGAMLAKFAGIDIVHIPYKGGGIALADVLGGHVEIFFNAIPAMLPSVQANRLRALAVTSPRRFPGLPDVPTMTEAGFPQIGSTVWYGALAPPRLPASLLKTLHAAFVGAIAAPDLRDALVSGGSDVVGNSPQQFAEFLKKETESARELLKVSGAKRDF